MLLLAGRKKRTVSEPGRIRLKIAASMGGN